MPHRIFWFLLLIGSCWPGALPAKVDETTLATFEGVWSGEISAPDRQAFFGVAFTRAGKELLVSVYFPEMYLYSVNFGPAEIEDGAFTLPALNLKLRLSGEALLGSFASEKNLVKLHRGGVFESAPRLTDDPPPPRVAWSSALGARAWASPAYKDGVIYIGTIDGKFHALRAADGVPLWTWEGPQALYGEALATDEGIFFVDDGGDLVALARADGNLRWRVSLREGAPGVPLSADDTFNHRTACPVIDGQGVLYVGSKDGSMYAVKARSGKRLWRCDLKTKICAAAALRGEELVVGGLDGTVVVLNRRTHQSVTRIHFPGAVVSAPAVIGDRIVVGCRDYFLRGLDGATLKVAWENSFWFSWVESTPRVVDGILYVGSSDYRRVSALSAADGRTLWRTDVRGLSWGSPAVRGETVYAGTLGQTLAGTVIEHHGGLVAMDRATGKMKWRYLAPAAPAADFIGFAGSLVATETLLVGAQMDGVLVAFPLEGEPLSPVMRAPPVAKK
jgi:outer membrane protein assembly factor BamB